VGEERGGGGAVPHGATARGPPAPLLRSSVTFPLYPAPSPTTCPPRGARGLRLPPARHRCAIGTPGYPNAMLVYQQHCPLYPLPLVEHPSPKERWPLVHLLRVTGMLPLWYNVPIGLSYSYSKTDL